jgi:DNA-binding CsgD family transcriptional regulator
LEGKADQRPSAPRSGAYPAAIVDPVTADEREVWYQGVAAAPRAAAGVVLILLTAAHGEPRLFVAGIVAGLLVGTSAMSWVSLTWPRGSFLMALRTGRWSVVTDVLVCLLGFGLFQLSSEALATVLFPFLIYVLAARFGRSGAAAGAAAMTAAIGARVAERILLLHLSVGWVEIVAVAAAGSACAAFALTLRRQRGSWETAVAEQRRLAEALRLTLLDILDRPEPEPATELIEQDVEELVEVACQFPELAPDLGRRIAAVARDPAVTHGLSRRELEVLNLMVAGASDRDISRRLFIEVGTVRVHVSHIVHKLGVADRHSVVALIRRHPAWRRRQLADLTPPRSRRSRAVSGTS